MLPVVAGHKIKWRTAFFIGILISAVIEVSQLVFMRGLFEWDDMIHNRIGCMVGCIGTHALWKRNEIRNGKKHTDR